MASAIEFENISKQYRLGVVSTGTLSHDLNRFWHTKVLRREDPYLKIGETNDRSHQGKSEYVWALKNIDFKVEQGDVVGIIGKNGAGKSTLLKLLSRVTAPTTGIIRARGRIASLLEVGTGFHPEMTGRENIYMNGAIMGMTRSEITRKLDEIVDFSGCERYLDTPVKRYSSGMIVRLGFAIAAHLEPEILVVDEVLAVGDAEFQKKAIGKMQDVSQGEGRTVLFVSHNMGAVKNLCKRGVLLEQGKVKRIGPVNDVVDEYINQNQGIFEFTKYKDRSGNGTIKINSVEYFNSNNEKINTLKTGEEVIICVNYEIIQNMDHVMESYIDIGFNNLNGSRVAWISSRIFQKKLDPNLKSIKFKIPHLMLDQGSYTINIHCETNIARADWLKNVGNFDVVFDNYFGTNKTIPNNQGSVVLDFQLIK
jgi:lipopolysaccharide transport system ATP-binding protein